MHGTFYYQCLDNSLEPDWWIRDNWHGSYCRGDDPEEQRFVEEEMNRSIDLDALARSVPNQQVAAQLYTASLMAITVDTDAERRYLAELASKLKLEPQVVAYLHQVMGLT
ncbi:DUF533 domain-containing protein [Thiocystis minor]|uniref:DUF533 domain-containing protein n=1 Tax=Thiocystis minor TaxID=61597 RepID=UPI0030B8EB47